MTDHIEIKKANSLACRKCGATAFSCGGYLGRVNEKGAPGYGNAGLFAGPIFLRIHGFFLP